MGVAMILLGMEHLSCGAFPELLTAALDDELSPDERIRLDRHLIGCARCRFLQFRLKRLEMGFGQLSEASPPRFPRIGTEPI